jgi:hypothetical protein
MSTATASCPPGSTTVWVSNRIVCDILCLDRAAVRQLAAEGRLRSRRIEGAHTKYSLSDALRIAEEAEAGPSPVSRRGTTTGGEV